MGLAAALNTGKSSLFTNQKAIEIAGNNIANVNTEGYSRQKAVYSDFPSLKSGSFFVGQGVKITDITREYDVFVNEQLLDKSQLLGSEDAKATPLAELERIFNIGENNLATEIDRFFDSWQELSANPSGQVERDIVIQRGELLSASFNTIARDLDNAKSNINETILSEIDGVNLKLNQIADLNGNIQTIEANGQSANSFRDQRDVLIRELTYTLGVQSFEEPTGAINVQLPGGLPLVQSGSALQLEAISNGDDLTLQLNIGESSFDISGKNLGGKFEGLFELRDEFIPALEKDLDLTAYELVQSVNDLHEKGVGLDGSTGVSFFNNPGTHASQTFAAHDVDAFSGGTVSLVVDGVDLPVDLATGPHTLDAVSAAINTAVTDAVTAGTIATGKGVVASVQESSDGGYVLSILPQTHNDSVQLDFSNIGDSYDAPEFSMDNLSGLISMSLTNTSKLAAGHSSAPGDNTNALDISALKDANSVNGEDTFVSFYGKMAARVGIEAGQNLLSQAGAEDSLTQLKNMRDGAVGVSLEEEMISLMKFQRGFEASAKLLATVDEMMLTVLNIKR
ncbi:MAG: flagellar hook-associated protein FlgK [Deltaproteobacteria bacterium]|nr:flagellar hook-associated protein FlgK [Deltaproteobacteria bacterium]